MVRDGRVFFAVNGPVACAGSRDPRVAAELRAYMASLAITKRLPMDRYGNKYNPKAKH